MSETPGWERPADDRHEPAAAEPPYPGWSTRQPAGSGWTAPGQPKQPAEPPAPPGVQSGWAAPPPAAAPGTGWGWTQPPAVKPGVVPLRPLGVGEILDGAVTTIRRNPGPMLGLSAIVAVVTQLLGLGLLYWLYRDVSTLTAVSPGTPPAEVLSLFAGLLGASAVVALVSWIATVLLTGILTVVVSRAVIGERHSVGAAWQAARPRLPRLLLLTLLYSLCWLAPFLAVTLLALLIAASGMDAEALAAVVVLLALASAPIAIWLYVRYVLAGPTLMLESTPTQPHRPVGVIGAFRRSAELVKGSWWRIFGILLLVLLIASIVSQVVAVPFGIPFTLVMDDPGEGAFLPALVLMTLGGMVASTITAPFTAAATALLYVDRRIRREGLDIQLARAAGVTIPGRTDAVR